MNFAQGWMLFHRGNFSRFAGSYYNVWMVSKGASATKPSEWTVAGVTRLIKDLIEGEPDLSAIWIKGEASNIRLAGSGHLYFTLKDEHSELRCVFFGFGRRRKKPPGEGDALLIHGDVRVYEKRGEYQIVCDDLVKAGVGDLAGGRDGIAVVGPAAGRHGSHDDRVVALHELSGHGVTSSP